MLLAVNQQVDNDWPGCGLCPSFGLMLIFSDRQESSLSSRSNIQGQVRKKEKEELQPWPSPLLGKVKACHETPTKFCLCFLVANVFGKEGKQQGKWVLAMTLGQPTVFATLLGHFRFHGQMADFASYIREKNKR